MSKKESKVAPQGSVIEPGGERTASGKPNLMPTAGYDGHYPVQFSDEADSMFASRVAMFESSYATAKQIENGGATLEDQLDALEARYEADKAALEALQDEEKAAKKKSK